MHTGDKLLLIFAVSAACCFVLPFAPNEIRDWVYYGSGRWLIPLFLVGGMATTIWKHD